MDKKQLQKWLKKMEKASAYGDKADAIYAEINDSMTSTLSAWSAEE